MSDSAMPVLFSISLEFRGADDLWIVRLDAREVYATKERRDADMFIAELRVKSKIAGGICRN